MPNSRTHMDTAFRARRTDAPNPVQFHGAAEIRQARPAPTGSELREDRNLALSSIFGGDQHRAAVLALACREHDASAGSWCWASDRSVVRGFCAERWTRGVTLAQRVIFGGVR